MQGVILAAGKGSRLQPITLQRSKAMLPILGRPIVERVMENLQANGVQDFILVVSPEDREIIRYFRSESTLQADVRFVFQPQRLGMADALSRATLLIEGDFCLSACDNLTSPDDVGALLAAFHGEPRPNAVLTLMPVSREQVSSTGIVALEGGEWVTRIVEKPRPEQAPSNMASLPLYCFTQRILSYLQEVKPSPRGEYELQDAIQMLIERDGRVRGSFIHHRLTLTSPADLLAINCHYLEGGNHHPQLAPLTVGAGTHLITPLRIEEGTIIGQGCTIGPNVYIERECQIGAGATIRDAVVLRRASVPVGAKVVDQVVS